MGIVRCRKPDWCHLVQESISLKPPSHKILNWLGVGLSLLFVWVLLASVIVPRLPRIGAASGNQAAANTATPAMTVSATEANDGTPQAGIMGGGYAPLASTATLTPDELALISAPKGAVITAEE